MSRSCHTEQKFPTDAVVIMHFSHLIKSRKSIRGYQQKPVPREVIEEIIAVAKWAPSSMNTQPWHVHVVTGEPLDRIRQGNMNNMLKGIPAKRDFPMKEAYEGQHRQRQVAVGYHVRRAVVGGEVVDRPDRAPHESDADDVNNGDEQKFRPGGLAQPVRGQLPVQRVRSSQNAVGCS